MAMKKPRIMIVGCGPGGADHLTDIARRTVEQAEVLVGAPRLLAAFPTRRARRIPVTADIAQVLRRMAACRGRRLVVLVTGDPGLCSLARPVIRRFGRAACRVIPGISAIQAAFAAVGADWLDARIVSAHSRVPSVSPASLAGVRKLAVLAGHRAARSWLAAVAASLGRGYCCFVCANLTLPGESVRRMGLAALRRRALPACSVVLFIRKEELT